MKLKSNNLLTIILLSVFTTVVISLIFYLRPSENTSESTSFKTIISNKYTHALSVGGKNIKIDIANDLEEEMIGLSGRKSMCENCGMYFDLGYKDTIPTFWMKDMLFPIDIVWIDDGAVVEITKNVPAPEPGAKDHELPRYFPSHKIDNVLELNAGYSEKNNIKVGDSVVISN